MDAIPANLARHGIVKVQFDTFYIHHKTTEGPFRVIGTVNQKVNAPFGVSVTPGWSDRGFCRDELFAKRWASFTAKWMFQKGFGQNQSWVIQDTMLERKLDCCCRNQGLTRLGWSLRIGARKGS